MRLFNLSIVLLSLFWSALACANQPADPAGNLVIAPGDELLIDVPSHPELGGVRVVDVRKGRLWPKDRVRGHTLPPVETPTTSQSSSTYAEKLAKTISGEAAVKVVQLFCEHEVPYEGGWPGKE